MGRVKSLTTKGLVSFFIFTAVILLCCFPLLYFLMENKYAEDLDEVIEYRTEEFTVSVLPELTVDDIEQWNKFNEDIAILPFDDNYPFNKVGREEFFNKAEGHPVFYRILYTEISISDKRFALAVKVPMIEAHDLISMLATQYGVIFIIIIVWLSVIYVRTSKYLWKPFYQTLEEMDHFSLQTGKAPQFEKTDIKEFRRLNEQLKKLIKNNLSIYNQQKEFVENASHELQTPLAVFQSQIDTLLQQPDLTEAEMNIIQSLYSTSSRMIRLNKNLLLLAKMDNEQFVQRETFDFVKIFYDRLSPLKELAESNNIKVSVNVNSAFNVHANYILLESLITNLFVNAIRHNSLEKGSINIFIDENRFSICNTGQKDSLNAEKIFKRFSRTSEEKKGNGLGLSIVRQICKLHNWTVEYDFANKQHVFTVFFNSKDS